MSRLFDQHNLFSALSRGFCLLRGVGLVKTISTLISNVDDRYLKCFDRKYRIRTSGFISLASTSFAPSRLPDTTRFGLVNGWALPQMLKELALSWDLSFVDLGCGLGRACILAAEYGFTKVTGVDLSPELCIAARENVAHCRLPSTQTSSITILQMDALEYCDRATDDVFFMFRPFSGEFMGLILTKLIGRANSLNKPFIIIYTERLLLSQSYGKMFSENRAFRKMCEAAMFGQAFWVYQYTGQILGPAQQPTLNSSLT